jgi:hypothetical protein
MNISCVHHNIPNDLTLPTQEHNHPSLPHLVVLFIERSVEDPNPIPGIPSLDLRLVRALKDPNRL